VSTDLKVSEQIKDYYGRILKNSQDLKTDACCAVEPPPEYINNILKQIDNEIVEKFYGCGSPIPDAIEGCTILDLGCGAGRDVYICSMLVGETGKVIGLDMTKEQLEVARRHQESQTHKFGLEKPNMTFLQGYMEGLGQSGIEDSSIDVVISNCVINLSPDKERVFSEIFRALRPGGELFFSDIFADRRLPEHLREDPVLAGECLAGAMYVEDFRRLLHTLGVPDYRITSQRRLDLMNPEVQSKVGAANFYSMTVRAFKLPSLEDRCEDYGQIVRYLGTIENSPHLFIFDDHHEFITGKPTPVCGNTAAMISETRLNRHFRVEGDRSRHFGLFSNDQAGVFKRLDGLVTVNSCC
jgi:ubiquinone/menaquinone biosynthesis C-methylase UbiE